MGIKHNIHRAVRTLALGATDLPQACDVDLQHPQHEILVRFLGLGPARDVTFFHSVACSVPFTFCIGFESSALDHATPDSYFDLEFCERQNETNVLGRIKLRYSKTLPADDYCLGLFEAVECHNFCISNYHLGMHRVFNAFNWWRDKRPNKENVPNLDFQCNAVTFICPRPVVLVCVANRDRGNVFPMNLLGDLGNDYFAFALNSRKQASPAVRRVQHLTVSTVPFDKKNIVRQLGKNHYQESIAWDELPLQLQHTHEFDVPSPEFAIRTKELQVLETLSLGSHDFFLAKTIRDLTKSSEQEFCMIHGFYSAYRNRKRGHGHV
jgi:flavin reductase (DIM6/NTAB) family NADH-FMN oxidoreductase RutF